jgi:ABC-type transport system involved in multi-copper enzyme maturation permease subunit
MNTAILVASRELRDRTRLFVVAIALSLIPFLVAAMPGARSHRGMAIATIAAFLAFAYPAALALALGMSTIGRELTEKRLSFYFSKPISPAAIWIGKAVAAMVTVYAVMTIVALPAFLIVTKEWTAAWSSGGAWMFVAVPVTLLALFLGGHALSTMIRSRSLLIAVDFVLAVLATMALLLILRPVFLGGAQELVGTMLIAVGAALLVILALAPIGQLAHGRTDVRRNHAALSRFLWPAVAGVLAITGAFVLWISSASIEQLDSFGDLRQNATGEWLLVHGGDNARFGFASSFLVNTTTGERERLRLPMWWGANFSRDGRILSWLEPTELLPRNGALQLFVRRLDGAGARNVTTPIQMRLGSAYVFSDDGSRVAIAYGNELSVADVASGQILAAAKAFPAQLMFFAGRDTLRLVGNGNVRAPALIGELDIARRRFVETGRIAPPAHMFGVSANHDGSLLYIQPTATVVDGRTGAVVSKLPVDVRGTGSRMLNDGTIVVVGQHMLRRFDAHGRELLRTASPMERANVLGEIGASKIVLGWAGGAQIVDLQRGVVEQHIKGAHPAWSWSRDPRVRRYTAGAAINYIQRLDGKLQVLKTKTAS